MKIPIKSNKLRKQRLTHMVWHAVKTWYNKESKKGMERLLLQYPRWRGPRKKHLEKEVGEKRRKKNKWREGGDSAVCAIFISNIQSLTRMKKYLKNTSNTHY